MSTALSPTPTVLTITTPVALPATWQRLLTRRSLAHAATAPAEVAVDDPTPYRDDFRAVRVDQDGVAVVAELCSGNGNYWFSWGVYRPDADGSLCTRLNPEDVIADRLPLPSVIPLRLVDGGRCVVTVTWR